MIERGSMPARLGFRTAKSSAHQGRSIMSRELSRLIGILGRDVELQAFETAILDDNLLEKQTTSNRKITYEFLAYTYGLDRTFPLFRALLRLWPSEDVQRQFMAFQMAMARDALLRASVRVILPMEPGVHLEKAVLEAVVIEYPEIQYSANSVASFGRNLGSTWTQAGFFQGKVGKCRSPPQPGPANAAFACFCAYLDGWQGEYLLTSPWMGYLDLDRRALESLVDDAARLGMLRLLKAGDVYEFRFPGFLTHDEEAYLVQA